MFSFSTLLLPAADANSSPRSTAEHSPGEWQIKLMAGFYAPISAEGIMVFSRNIPSRDFCNWTGIQCTDGDVSKVRYISEDYGDFNIQYLPPTVKIITIDGCQQHYELQTRKFPRELQTCILRTNRLFGSVELRALPIHLVGMSLVDNQLTGPIVLTSLPSSLEWLNIERNRIVQSVVWYDCLPASVRQIQLVSHKDPTNRIGKVRAVHRDAVDRKDIFMAMPKQNVQ